MIIELKLKFFKAPNQLWLAAWEVDKFKWEQNNKNIIKVIANTLNLYKNKSNLDYVMNEKGNILTFDLSGKPFVFYEIQNILNDYFQSLQMSRVLE